MEISPCNVVLKIVCQSPDRCEFSDIPASISMEVGSIYQIQPLNQWVSCVCMTSTNPGSPNQHSVLNNVLSRLQIERTSRIIIIILFFNIYIDRNRVLVQNSP